MADYLLGAVAGQFAKVMENAPTDRCLYTSRREETVLQFKQRLATIETPEVQSKKLESRKLHDRVSCRVLSGT